MTQSKLVRLTYPSNYQYLCFTLLILNVSQFVFPGRMFCQLYFTTSFFEIENSLVLSFLNHHKIYLYKKSDQNRDLVITWIETASTISFKLSSLSSTQIEYIFRLLLKISVSGWLSRDLINFFYRPILSRMAIKTLSVLHPPWTVSVEAECIFIIFNWTVLTNISMYCWLT